MPKRTPHTFGKTVRLDPPVRWDSCDECGKIEHLRPWHDELLCETCRMGAMLELPGDYDDAA